MTILKGLPGRYAKFLTALIGFALIFAQTQYGPASKWVLAATSVAAALGVAGVPNVPKPPPAPVPGPPPGP